MASEKDKKAWRAAPEVKEVADRLIKTIAEHNHLAFCNVVYLFNKEVEKVRGAEALATASKLTGRNAYFLWSSADELEFIEPESCFVVSVWEEGWNNLTLRQQEALVDHELCHCKVVENEDGTGKLYIKPHDIEEFNTVVSRHGHWRPDIASFIRDAEAGQKRMDFDAKGQSTG